VDEKNEAVSAMEEMKLKLVEDQEMIALMKDENKDLYQRYGTALITLDGRQHLKIRNQTDHDNFDDNYNSCRHRRDLLNVLALLATPNSRVSTHHS
jgi:hypothetical protein